MHLKISSPPSSHLTITALQQHAKRTFMGAKADAADLAILKTLIEKTTSHTYQISNFPHSTTHLRAG
jgi:hypothetical protein